MPSTTTSAHCNSTKTCTSKQTRQKKSSKTQAMRSKHHPHRTLSMSQKLSSIIRPAYIIIATLSFTSFYLFFSVPKPSFRPVDEAPFIGDLRDANFPWNKLCFGPSFDKLTLGVFSKTWPIGAAPGGMERHALTLYQALASKGHEIHVFTVPSDRNPAHKDIHEGNLHVYYVANDHGSVNTSLAFELFAKVNKERAFDYAHTESVSLPHWRAKMVPNLAVTWHGIWYEIMHSKIFQELVFNKNSKEISQESSADLQQAVPKLIDEIRFFSSYKHHICISNSAREVLVNIYQIPQRNVHIILNGVDEQKFVYDPESGSRFRIQYGVPNNVSLVMGVAGRLVRDKGHPLLYEAFSSIARKYPNVFLLVAGSGPWGRRYAELGSNVKVLGALEPSDLNKFYNAIDIFVNPTLRPQGLDLTLIEAMRCGKTVVTPNFPSITGTVVVNEELGYTFAPNVKSFVQVLELIIEDGRKVLERKGRACKEFAESMFTANKMASAYERFFLCMKNDKYCHYPLPTDC